MRRVVFRFKRRVNNVMASAGRDELLILKAMLLVGAMSLGSALVLIASSPFI